jgi:hypothetical protein
MHVLLLVRLLFASDICFLFILCCAVVGYFNAVSFYLYSIGLSVSNSFPWPSKGHRNCH